MYITRHRRRQREQVSRKYFIIIIFSCHCTVTCSFCLDDFHSRNVTSVKHIFLLHLFLFAPPPKEWKECHLALSLLGSFESFIFCVGRNMRVYIVATQTHHQQQQPAYMIVWIENVQVSVSSPHSSAMSTLTLIWHAFQRFKHSCVTVNATRKMAKQNV